MTTIDEVIEATKQMKEGCDWNDLQPILHMIDNSGEANVALLAGETTGPIFWAAIARLLKESSAVAAFLICDARMTVRQPHEGPPGSLQEKWLAGEREGIVECFVILEAHREDDGSVTVKGTNLVYDAYFRTWEDPEDAPEHTGGVVQALKIGLSR